MKAKPKRSRTRTGCARTLQGDYGSGRYAEPTNEPREQVLPTSAVSSDETTDRSLPWWQSLEAAIPAPPPALQSWAPAHRKRTVQLPLLRCPNLSIDLTSQPWFRRRRRPGDVDSSHGTPPFPPTRNRRRRSMTSSPASALILTDGIEQGSTVQFACQEPVPTVVVPLTRAKSHDTHAPSIKGCPQNILGADQTHRQRILAMSDPANPVMRLLQNLTSTIRWAQTTLGAVLPEARFCGQFWRQDRPNSC